MKRIIILLAFAIMNSGIVNIGGSSAYAASVFSIMQPRAVKKAQKQQAKKEKEENKAIKKSNKAAKKRAFEIQSPEVKKRMKQNQKDIKAREKAKRKNNKAATRAAARRYR